MPRSVERRNNSSASAPEHETPPQDTPPAERAPATREELERRLADTTGRVVAELATAAEASQRRALESTARVGGAAEGAALLDRQQEELRQAAEVMDRELSDLGGNENSRGALVATVEDKMRTLREQAASAEAFLPKGQERKAAEGAFVDLHKPPVDSEVDYVARLSLTQEQERLRQGGGESETAYLRETLQQWASGDAQYERSRREDIFPGWAPEDFQRALQARDRARQAPASAPQQEGPIARARRWLRKLKS